MTWPWQAVNVHRSTHQGDWLVIPAKQEQFHEAVTVFYFDLGKNRIPVRYERHLPMKVAEIVSELEAGKSFVLAKERQGAPPSILIAAPRTPMLREVEAALAKLDHLPTAPLYVETSSVLRPEEIQGVVRGEWFDAVRGCYETLLAAKPAASGRFVAKLELDREGGVSDARMDELPAALDDSAFVSCLTESVKKLHFPKSGAPTTVSYPIVVTP